MVAPVPGIAVPSSQARAVIVPFAMVGSIAVNVADVSPLFGEIVGLPEKVGAGTADTVTAVDVIVIVDPSDPWAVILRVRLPVLPAPGTMVVPVPRTVVPSSHWRSMMVPLLTVGSRPAARRARRGAAWLNP